MAKLLRASQAVAARHASLAFGVKEQIRVGSAAQRALGPVCSGGAHSH